MSSHDWRFLREQIECRGLTEFEPKPGDGSMLMCGLVDELQGLPAVPSTFGVCDHCGDDIYWSLRAPRIDHHLCVRCAAIAVAKDLAAGEKPQFSTTAAIKRGVERWIGRPIDLRSMGVIVGRSR